MRHQHKHWHTPIVPPNLAEFEIITELEKKLAEELKSDPNLTLIASQDSLTARLSVNTQKPAKTPLSEMIKNATMRIEMLKEKERAARERAAIESIRHRLEKDKLEPEDKTKNQDQVNEDLVESLSCCGLGRRITGKSKKVHPQRSVYEEQRSKMSRQLREKRKK
ncbi:hypothetical protein BC830DRAFT_491957 [Chytriomyces sp. MP71]|nr:hypothetical protein BC830DRAFT_491957 [Chytriomyces sp. MP71]